MGKTLYMVRHAKSDWSVPGQKDIDRELNIRGRNDAPRMGRKLYDMQVKPDLMVSSPAERAKLTALYIAEQLKYDIESIKYDEEVYEASVRSLLGVINSFEDKYEKIMLFGHNPAFTYLAEYLTKKAFENIPTCGVVEIYFEVNTWKEVSGDIGELKMFIYPKNALD